jgi:hypothetical protein
LKLSQFSRQAQNHNFKLELIVKAKTILPNTNQTYQNQLYFKSKTIQSDDRQTFKNRLNFNSQFLRSTDTHRTRHVLVLGEFQYQTRWVSVSETRWYTTLTRHDRDTVTLNYALLLFKLLSGSTCQCFVVFVSVVHRSKISLTWNQIEQTTQQATTGHNCD